MGKSKIKIVTVVGARPQFVKAAVLSREIAKHNQQVGARQIEEILVHTGQHYDANMSGVFFQEMEIPNPNYHLGVSGSLHGAMTGKMLEEVEKVFLKEKPDWGLVFGDTNSTVAGALAGAKLHIPMIHVEAGIRSFDKKMPEEINRILTDHCSQVLYTPSELAGENLLKEGISKKSICLVGDIVYDALLYYRNKAFRESSILDRLKLQPKGYVVATIHRQQNTEEKERLIEICEGLFSIAQHVPVVFPLHPRTRERYARLGLLETLQKKCMVVDPIGYFDMLMLVNESQLIVTDSGGLQRESFYLKVPCVTMRDSTEWPQLIEHGFSELVEPNRKDIVEAYFRGIKVSPNWNLSLFGKGDTGASIVKSIAAMST